MPVPASDHLGRIALHGVTVGQGPALLLLHGFLQSSWAWRHNLAAFATRFTTHALCLPGFGWSDKPLGASYRLPVQARRVLAWMDRMAIAEAHIVGNSLGGALALQLAAVAPDRVQSLILVNPAGPGWYPMASLSRLQTKLWSPLVRHVPGVSWGLKMGLRHVAYAQLDIDDDYMHHFLAPLRTEGGPEAALSVARHFAADMNTLERRTPGVLAPTLMLRGGRDQVMPRGAFDRVAKRLRSPQITVLEDCAHCPMEERPSAFHGVANAFWDALPPARTPPE